MVIAKNTLKSWTGTLLALLAFTLPIIPRFQLSLLAALLIIFLIDNKNKFRQNSHRFLPAYALILFYLIYVVGLMWTENYKSALLDLQIKLPLLILPVVIYFSKNADRSLVDKTCTFFIYGLEFSIYFCLLRALYLFLFLNTNSFLYKSFSFFIHPGYFSMFVALGSVMILHELLENNCKRSKIYSRYRLFLFSVAVILLASKAGIFVQLFILLCAALSSVFLKSKISFSSIVFPAGLAIMIIYFGLFFPLTSGRMSELKETLNKPDGTEIHTSAMRIQAWKSATDVIKENKWLGSGTGDSKSLLLEKYLDNGYTQIYKLNLNAHNQFLQTGVTLGIPGLLILISIFVYGFLFGIASKNWLLISLMLISTVNFMVESVLEVSAGCLFFSLFFTLFAKENISATATKKPSVKEKKYYH
jgi:O-antigen ligase